MTTFLVSENTIMWAFRYALGRRTGAVSDVVDTLKNNWEQLRPETREQIRQEIVEAITQDRAGDQCDIDTWKQLWGLKE